MSRYEEWELSTLDIEWYGVDKRGQIAVFCSGGEGNIPEFVCADRERVDFLIDFFGGLPTVSECEICFVPPPKNPLPVQVAEEFAGRGLYYFDANDQSRSAENISVDREYYTKAAYPKTPLTVDGLPPDIREMLESNRLQVADFSAAERVYIEHAYTR